MSGQEFQVSDLAAAQAAVAAHDPVAVLRGVAVAATEAQYDGVIAAGFAYQGKLFQIDDGSRQDMAAIGAMALGSIRDPDGSPWSAGFYWIAADNSEVPMSAAEAYAFTFAAGAYVSSCILYCRALKNHILAAGTADAVAAVDVAAGWPASQ
ncbi:DUF4376 domain-containing protein [Aliidongia sp.]|uniref:DUF4376 domain-containing protein n=1 Tax=Aliidongia sp. TaxID=1914230 RepID=UPI002DDDA443|nr:DUF4376 domain-containing protein [Aliidongia sp.]